MKANEIIPMWDELELTPTTRNLVDALCAAFDANSVIIDGDNYWSLEALIDTIVDNSTPSLGADGTLNDPGEWIGEHDYSAQPHRKGMAVYEVRPDGTLESVPAYEQREGVHWEGDNIVDDKTGEVVDHA